ncbi:hypothetical protein Pmani_012955 [Petrolisthes manimaculis]|uniref:Uncharacterized protein n=1 Tax=Petrolisthes manimaculis TaxID=1843537 RepID=A0AAE1PWR3_9EUCA|nr:hypothetical protein Pmani_012955 [Petrolisthes manimaculis]
MWKGVILGELVGSKTRFTGFRSFQRVTRDTFTHSLMLRQEGPIHLSRSQQKEEEEEKEQEEEKEKEEK